MKIYYNCDRPLEVLASQRIRISSVFKGVSLSQEFNIGSHGPFKLEFDNPPWLPSLTKVLYFTAIKHREPGKFAKIIGYADQHKKSYTINEYNQLLENYGSRLIKREDFEDEEEWWRAETLVFTIEQVNKIYFMLNAPCLYPIVTSKARKALHALYPHLYSEITINDSYLK